MANDFFIEIEGTRLLQGFENIQVKKDMTSLADGFSLSFSVKEEINDSKRIPLNLIRAQDQIAIFIDEKKILTGFVDKLSTSYNSGSRIVNIGGHSKTIDIVESSIEGNAYTATDFEALVREVFNNNSITDIKIINNLGVLPITMNKDTTGSFSTESEVSDKKKKTSEKVFDFLDKYANQAKVLLRTNADGNIVFEREEAKITIGNLLSTKGNTNNNIKEAHFNIDASGFFRKNAVFTEENNDVFFGIALDPSGSYEDPLVRTGRTIRVEKQFVDESATLKEIAEWEANVRRGRSITYNCVVQGYYNDRNSTSLWEINKLVKVLDDKCLVDGQFLIKSVIYNKDLNAGSTTTLEIVNRGTFNLDPDVQILDRASNDFGSQWFKTDF